MLHKGWEEDLQAREVGLEGGQIGYHRGRTLQVVELKSGGF